MSLKNTVMSGLRWSVGMRLLAQTFTWTVTIIVIRILSPEDYGLMEIAGVFIVFLTMISEMGLGAAIVQRKDLNDDELRSIFGFIIIVSLLLCLFLISLSPIISEFYAEPLLMPMLIALSFIFLISGLAVVPKSLLLRNLQYKKIATIELCSAISGSICTLVMALMGMGVWALVGGYLTIRLTWMVLAQLSQPYLRLPSISSKGMASIFVFSGQITASRILWYLYTSAAASLILGKILGSEILGYYGVGLLLACLPMEKIGEVINQVAFPAFSSVQDDPDLAGKHLSKAVRVLSLIAFPVFWGISAIAPEIVQVFLGEKWLKAVLPLQIIAIILPLRMVRNLFNPALTGLGRADLDLRNEIVGVIIMPSSFLIATNWGLLGVSMAWVLAFPVVFMINQETTRKALNLSFSIIYRAMLRPAACGIIMYVAVIGARSSLASTSIALIDMVILIAIGGVAYMLASATINRRVVKEVVDLVRT